MQYTSAEEGRKAATFGNYSSFLCKLFKDYIYIYIRLKIKPNSVRIRF